MTTLFNTLIPPGSLVVPTSKGYAESLGNKTKACSPERTEAICMRLALRVLHVAYFDFLEGNYQRFDGNPGDSQCQVRAACIYTLTQKKREVVEELERLCGQSGLPLNADYSGKDMRGLAKTVTTLVCSNNTKALPEARKQFDQLQLSFSVQLLLQTYLSEILRDVVKVSSTGTVLTAGTFARLDRIETGLNPMPAVQKAILEYNQRELSKNSARYLQSLAPEQELYVRQVDCIEGNPVPMRTFTCLFSTTSAALQIPRIICLREIVPKLDEPVDPKRCQRKNSRPPQELYFQMPEGVCIAKPPRTPVMVVEAEIPDMQKAKEFIEKTGLIQALLAQAAICAPFEKGTTPADLPPPVQEIANALAEKQPPFTLDHYFIQETTDA